MLGKLTHRWIQCGAHDVVLCDSIVRLFQIFLQSGEVKVGHGGTGTTAHLAEKKIESITIMTNNQPFFMFDTLKLFSIHSYLPPVFIMQEQ